MSETGFKKGARKRGPYIKMKSANKHEHWMKLALDLARKGEGLTRPNPPVGAVIIKNGRLVGAGFHKRAGKDHAEVIALKKAGPRAKNANLYVTLEPCSTFGRTPPCIHAIIKSGISKVITAASDPNPRHRGRGIVILKKAGIKVIEGVCRNDGQKLIEPFKKWILSGKPYVSLKMAMSYDGKTADHRGHSRWITGKSVRFSVQDMRRRSDAVLVGAGTVLADNPSLLPKPSLGRRPYRIILDAKGLVPPEARALCDSSAGQTIMATTMQCPARRRHEWGKHGAQIWLLPSKRGQVSIPALMNKIGRMGLLRVLCEGGSEVASSLIHAGMVDEFIFFIAPCLIGGKNAPSAIGGAGWRLAKAPRLRFTECQQIGNDILIRAKPLKRRQKPARLQRYAQHCGQVVRSQNI